MQQLLSISLVQSMPIVLPPPPGSRLETYIPDLRVASAITTLSTGDSGELFIAGGATPNDKQDDMLIDSKVFIGNIMYSHSCVHL